MPKAFRSSSMQREPRFGRGPNVAGVQVLGTIHFEDQDELEVDDTIQICWIPDNAYILNYQFNFPAMPGLQLRLEDHHHEDFRDPRDPDEFEETVYASAIAEASAGGVFTPWDVQHADLDKLGTMYAATPRKLGRDGAAVKRWKRGVLLQFKVMAGHVHTSDKTIVYLIGFAPTYDAGV